MENKDLCNIGKKFGTDKVTHGYLEIYRHYLNAFNKKSKLLEIGIYKGASLKTFKEYLNCDVWGLDINKHCKKMEDDGFKIIIGSQSDRELLKTLPDFDIIIDDGSHQIEDILVSFEELFPKLNKGGLYIIEDLHASYMLEQRGNHREKIEDLFLKIIKDVDQHGSEVEFIHFYRKLCLIKKKK